MATRHGQHARDGGWRNAGLVVVSVGLNAGLIGLLVAERQAPIIARAAAFRPIFIDIEPVVRNASPKSQTFTHDRRSVQATGVLAEKAPHAQPTERTRQAPLSVSQAGPADDYDPEWTVRADGSRPGRRVETRSRSGPPNCDWPETLSPREREICQSQVVARNEGNNSMIRAGDDGRTAGFAREAAAKKRWRDYREGDGEYPGLRSLFGLN